DCLYVGAGMQNNALGKILVENELGGLEFICSIPGCVGGLLRTNAGCFGADTAAVLQKARVMDGNGKIIEVPAAEFAFGYRSSAFPSDWIVLGVYLKYQKASKEQIEAVIRQNAEYRKTHQPQNVRTAGSTFKNPEGYKAWQLIKESGADVLQIGGARMSPHHCNFLVNDGTATAKDIEDLMEAVTKTVKAHSGVDLVSEIKIVGNR
ncbi:MAG: UDP-N-acetylmuramate dehydrogenase, partial [Alphaproteobacteria bacterium]|nr:UDP-N-acetylmuramate dehydrogenase [Alphaproteobacteria bacterium]